MLTFKPRYFQLTVVLFIAEVLIAVYVHDAIIRPYGGDFLVVILIYCFVKSFVNLRVKTAAIWVLVLSFAIELSQYFKLVKLLGLKNSKLANVVLGNSFALSDLVAYTLGILVVLWIESLTVPAKLSNGEP